MVDMFGRLIVNIEEDGAILFRFNHRMNTIGFSTFEI